MGRSAAAGAGQPGRRAQARLRHHPGRSGGHAAVASLSWRALPAWFCPPRHLHDRPARMRASLATALMSWSMLAGLGLVFAQLTQLQGITVPGHLQVRWAYAVFDVTLAISALVAGLGGLPLW